MDDKEFRKLHREDLIEIIYQYQRREQRLLQENEVLRRQLEDRRIRMEKTGSIAEAALALSGIFEAAQKAVDMYTQSVKAGVQNPEGEKAPAAAAKPQQQAFQAAKPQTPAVQPQQQAFQAAKSQTPAVQPRQQAPQAAKPQVRPAVNAVSVEAAAPRKNDRLQNSSKAAQPDEQPEKAPAFQEAPAAAVPPVGQPAVSGKPEIQSAAVLRKAAPEAERMPAPRNAAAPRPQTPVGKPQAPARNPAPAVDTDEFIASLKDYLGM